MRYATGILVLIFGVSVLVWAQGDNGPAIKKDSTVKENFEELYKKAKQQRQRSKSFTSSPLVVLENTPALQEIMALGPVCIPYLMEKVHGEASNDFALLLAAVKILKAKPEKGLSCARHYRKWLDAKLKNGYVDAQKVFTDMNKKWQTERKQSKSLELWHDITFLDTEFSILRTKRELTSLGKVYSNIQDIGIFALPLLFEQLEKGQYDYLPIIHFLTDGKSPYAGKAKDTANICKAWWKKNKEKWLLPPIEAPKQEK